MDNDYLNGYAKIFGAVGTAIYVSLCRHADNETQKCFPAMDLMAEELGTNRKTISKYLKIFEENHLISIEKERDPRTKKWLNNVYTLLDKDEWASHGNVGNMAKSHGNLEENTPPSHGYYVPNKETHNADANKTHTAEASSAGGIALIIDLFKDINPAYKKWFGNTTQRKAVASLLERVGFEQLQKVIALLPKTNKIQYLPTITTPLQLEDKWASLEAGLTKEKNKLKANHQGIA